MEKGSKYLISSGTSTGKTSFITNELCNYCTANNKKIVILCNRRILKEQLIQNLNKKRIDVVTYQKYETIDYYDNIKYITDLDIQSLKEILSKYDYIVLDEAHYIFADSPFNKNTDTILKAIDKANSVVLLMTATPQLLYEYFKDKIEKTYSIETDYSYIDTVTYYDNKDAVNSLITQIPNNEKIIFFGQNKLRLQELKNNFENSDYIESGNRAQSKTVKQIINNNKFGCRILFTTKVLDNGVNLIDENLKHIFLEIDDMVTFVQCLGRKRVKENEKVRLYIYNYTNHVLQFKYQNLKSEIEIYHDWSCMPGEVFLDKYRRITLPSFFDNSIHIIKPTLLKAISDYNYYQSICENKSTFLDYVADALHKNKNTFVDFEKTKANSELAQYVMVKHFCNTTV